MRRRKDPFEKPWVIIAAVVGIIAVIVIALVFFMRWSWRIGSILRQVCFPVSGFCNPSADYRSRCSPIRYQDAGTGYRYPQKVFLSRSVISAVFPGGMVWKAI